MRQVKWQSLIGSLQILLHSGEQLTKMSELCIFLERTITIIGVGLLGLIAVQNNISSCKEGSCKNTSCKNLLCRTILYCETIL